VFGFQNRSNDTQLADLDASPITVFIDESDEFPGLILEVFVDDLEEVRETHEANGCKVLPWCSKNQDRDIQDSFGVIFNLWEG
jgi:hypothetical protein